MLFDQFMMSRSSPVSTHGMEFWQVGLLVVCFLTLVAAALYLDQRHRKWGVFGRSRDEEEFSNLNEYLLLKE